MHKKTLEKRTVELIKGLEGDVNDGGNLRKTGYLLILKALKEAYEAGLREGRTYPNNEG